MLFWSARHLVEIKTAVLNILDEIDVLSRLRILEGRLVDMGKDTAYPLRLVDRLSESGEVEVWIYFT